jgi:outer membrane protein
LIDETISSNPGLAALRDQVAAAQAMVSAVRLETKPVVTAYGYFGATPWHLVSEEINSAYAAAGVSLVVPISDGGVLKAEARQAEDQASSLTESSTDLQNRLLRDTRTAYDDVLAARNDIGVTDEMVRTARESYRLTAARFRIGLNSIVDLSQAQLALTQARVARANALYDYVERGAGLEYVTGALVPASTARP